LWVRLEHTRIDPLAVAHAVSRLLALLAIKNLAGKKHSSLFDRRIGDEGKIKTIDIFNLLTQLKKLSLEK
jgi:hypothetical protein